MANYLRRASRAIILAACLFSMPIGPAAAMELEDMIFSQGAFENPAYAQNPPPENVVRTDVCSVFSGHVGPETAAGWDTASEVPPAGTPNNDPDDELPEGEKLYLVQSSLGWAMPATVGWVNPAFFPSPDEPANAAEYFARKGYSYMSDIEQIYTSYYKNDDPQDPNSIYLAYDFIMTDPDTDERIVLPDGETLDPQDIYDSASSDAARQDLFTAYNMDPWFTIEINVEDEVKNVNLMYIMLDIAYYQSVALLMQGNLALERAFSLRFLEELRNPSNDIINSELKKLGWSDSLISSSGSDGDFSDQYSEGAWKYFNAATKIWLDVFSSPIQREYLRENASLRPLDYRDLPDSVFKQTAEPPDGVPADEWPPLIYQGYKDVAAMLRALAQRGRVVVEVARRLVLKLERPRASELIEEHIQQLALEEAVIMALFFKGGLPPDHEVAYPGLAESFLSFRDSVSRLGQLRDAAVNENLNALGFDRNVLFIHSSDPQEPNESLYTFNWLFDDLIVDSTQAAGALYRSLQADKLARDTRKDFLLKVHGYVTQFENIEDEYNHELINLCGEDPEDSLKPNLENPHLGDGLIAQQHDNVAIALNAIERVQREMENVHSRIEIERDRLAKIKDVSDKTIDIIYQTTGMVAKLTDEIAEIQGQMAIVNGIAQGITSGLSGFASGNPASMTAGLLAGEVHAANGFVQASMHKRMGEKQAAITKLQGDQQAKFEYYQQEMRDADSEAQIKTWFLDLRILEIDMLDAEIRYAQELKRLAQYYNQVESKVMRRDRATHRLAQRSMADPTYRIEVTNAALEAEDLFQSAQISTYLLAKALEYKHPIPDTQFKLSVFPAILRARTAESLKTLVIGMKNMDGYEEGPSYYYWSFSLRKDYLKMTFDKEIPDSRGTVQSPVAQFQEYLINLTKDSKNIVNVDNKAHLSVPFSTVKLDIEDDNYAQVTLKDSEGNDRESAATPVFQTGLWDSKIDWIQINFKGFGINDHYTQSMPVRLKYGGSGFLRTKENFPDPTDPNKEIDFLVYPNPAYDFTYKIVEGRIEWKVLSYIEDVITAQLVSDSDEPEYSLKTLKFRERPVAATDWRLLIPLDGTHLNNIHDIIINIVYYARPKPSDPE